MLLNIPSGTKAKITKEGKTNNKGVHPILLSLMKPKECEGEVALN
jgi:hypothetical protein